MKKETQEIKLVDGTSLTNLLSNGNCFVSNTEITADLSDTNLTTIVISGNDSISGWKNGTYNNVTLVRKWEDSGKYWLAFKIYSEQELKTKKLQSTIDDLTITLLALSTSASTSTTTKS